MAVEGYFYSDNFLIEVVMECFDDSKVPNSDQLCFRSDYRAFIGADWEMIPVF